MAEVSKQRIAKNALFLYLRMGLSVVVGLYTSRVVLQALGAEDYGIYNVVGGIIALFCFLNGAMSSATSRFMVYELGTGDFAKLKKTFSCTMLVHLAVAAIVLLFAETVGLWLLKYKLVIPEPRQTAAFWVYQCSILGAILSITQVPYDASIIAHERLDVYAYVQILASLLKLASASLLLIIGTDKLVFYAGFGLLSGGLIIFICRFFCIRRFRECHFSFVWDKRCLVSLFSYSSWNFFGSSAATLRQQLIAILINNFFGVLYNAASGIAVMIEGMVTSFTFNATLAYQPQIIKLYAQKEISKMSTLLESATCVGLLLQLIIMVPLLLGADFLLRLWLVEVPAMTCLFTQILLVSSLFSTLNCIFIIPVTAVGNIKLSCLFSGVVNLMACALVYLFYICGEGVEFAFYGILICKVLLPFGNLTLCKRYIREISVTPLLKKIVIALLIAVSGYCAAFYAGTLIPNSYCAFLGESLLTELIIAIMSYYLLFDSAMRTTLRQKITAFYDTHIKA